MKKVAQYLKVASRCLLVAIFAISILYTPFVHAQEEQDEELQKGIWNYQHENYDEALDILLEVHDRTPKSTLAAYYLGLTYKQLQNLEDARFHLTRAVTLKPRIQGALIELIDVLYRLEKLDEAKKWIRVAEREYIRPAQVAFFKGLVLVKEGKDLDRAIEALEEAKRLDNSLAKVADYNIGIAQIKAQKFKEARETFAGIIKEYPTTDLASFSNQYLEAIKTREKAMKPLKLAVGVAFQYDDNVILKPNDASLVSDIADEDDFREVFSFEGNYDFRPTDEFGTRLGYSMEYSKQEDLGFYDSVINSFEIQPSFYIEDFMISFPAGYGHFIVNDKNYLSLVRAGNRTNYMLANDRMLQAGFTYSNKDYLWTPTTGAENRDGNEFAWDLGYYHFFARNKGFLNLRYAMNVDDTKGTNWDYFGNRLAVTSLIPLFERVNLTVAGEFFLQNFLNSHTIYNEKRLDTILLFTTLLSFEIFEGAELQFQYSFIDNGSNIDVYDYTRNVGSVGVKYRF